MSIAYSRIKVRIIEVRGLEQSGLVAGSVWEKGMLAFRHSQEGRAAREEQTEWARAADGEGRLYVIWGADHIRFQGPVIQPEDSFYCFEVSAVSNGSPG